MSLQLLQFWIPDAGDFTNYSIQPPAQANEAAAKDAQWSFAWHGTWWYALWSILEAGRMLESNDASKGHDFLQGRPGVPALLQ